MADIPDTREEIAAPIHFHVPGDIVGRYATNLVVQRQEHEVVLSFFEVIGPIILSANTPPPTQVSANCVARITLARTRLQEFATLLQRAADSIHIPESEEKE